MDNVNTQHYSYNKVSDFMSVFNNVLEQLFVKKNHTINAKLVISHLQQRQLDTKKIQSFMTKLPEGEWSVKVFVDNIEELNEIFGLSDQEIVEQAVTELNKEDILQVRWKTIIESLTEYSRFSSEFYDALKYNVASDLSVSQLKLLNEFMLIFKLIKETSVELYDKYRYKKLSKRNVKELNEVRIVLEFFLLRLLYISINIKNADDKKFEEYAKLIGKERISLMYQKKYLPRFS